jgi:hypothetical protein
MRYYSIVITSPQTGQIIRPPGFASLNLPATYTSFVNGQSIPGALNVEFDILAAPFASAALGSFVRVWGISRQEISQASDLNGLNIAVYAGMQKGLPLATAAFNAGQSGLIAQGKIFQAFGNWIGTEMTLDLNIQPDTGTLDTPRNIVLNWQKGTPLSQAIATTLSTGFPEYQQSINISSKIVLPQDEVGFFPTLATFSEYVKETSRNILGGTYPGAGIQLTGKTLSVYDGTTPSTPKQIQFQDMIGQPTWIDPASVQTKFVMRADLNIGDQIKFPQGQNGANIPVTTVQGATNPTVNAQATFQGAFLITRIRHVGNFRQPDAAAWNTTVDAVTTPVSVS